MKEIQEFEKLSEFAPGQTFKNYKELCNSLGIKQYKSGSKSYKLQLERLSLYCDYHKEGHKIIIDKIHNEPKKKVANKKAKSTTSTAKKTTTKKTSTNKKNVLGDKETKPVKKRTTSSKTKKSSTTRRASSSTTKKTTTGKSTSKKKKELLQNEIDAICSLEENEGNREMPKQYIITKEVKHES